MKTKSLIYINRFNQASSPKPLGQLEPNLPGMFLGWFSTKFLSFVPVGYSTWLPDTFAHFNNIYQIISNILSKVYFG
jgi:hypothetical protein